VDRGDIGGIAVDPDTPLALEQKILCVVLEAGPTPNLDRTSTTDLESLEYR
jgi:hypothetical protein